VSASRHSQVSTTSRPPPCGSLGEAAQPGTACGLPQRRQVTGGSIRLELRELRGLAPHRIANLVVATIPERRKVFPSLTIRENLELARARWEVLEIHQSFRQILEMADRKAGQLSGGQRQLLALMTALGRTPKVLVIDEFTLGLASGADAQVAEAVTAAAQGSRLGIILIEQNVAVAQKLCSRVYIMQSGRMVWSGGASSLDETVLERGYFE